MPRKIVGRFEVPRLQILDENGNCDESLKPPLTEGEVKRFFQLMLLARTFDIKAFKLQRQGRIGTYPQLLGQEATQIGVAAAIGKEDWFLPYYRDMGALITLGVPMASILQFWSGDERGARMPEGVKILPYTIPVGTQIPHAVGLALAAKHRGEKIAVVATFGDGGTSKGDFHEGLNFAGVFKTPNVFVCENNQYAISVPRSRQSASETLAQKAVGYGVEGVVVDGNDVFAVYLAVKDAVEKSRSGGGSTFIECETYRMGDHTTSDDATRYRPQKEVEEWRAKDPLDRLRKYLKKQGVYSEEEESRMVKDAEGRVEEAVREMESYAPPPPEDIFRYIYAETPKNLREQMEELQRRHELGRGVR